MKNNELMNLLGDLLEIDGEVTENTKVDFSQIDSLTKVNMIISLEEHSNKSISLIDLLESRTIGDIIKLL